MLNIINRLNNVLVTSWVCRVCTALQSTIISVSPFNQKKAPEREYHGDYIVYMQPFLCPVICSVDTCVIGCYSVSVQ